MTEFVIRGARVLDPAQRLDRVADIKVRDGRIVRLGEHLQAETVVDGRGRWVLPGFTDLCHHLREPGQEGKGTMASELAAAARGGFTRVVCPPDTRPVNDSGAITRLILEKAAAAGSVRVLPLGALTKGLEGEQLSEMDGLCQAGCVALTQARRPVCDLRVLRRSFAYAASVGVKVFMGAQEAALAAGGVMHEGVHASRMGLPSIPSVAETIAVAQLLLLAEDTGVQLHISQVSCARSVEMIAEARSRGLAVTADAGIHHLLLTDEAVTGFNGQAFFEPPLREEPDRKALLEGVEKGVLQAVVSQHQPHDPAAKHMPFAECEPGATAAELVWPLLMKLVTRGELSLEAAARALTTGPAEVLGISAGLAEGQPADLVMVDPNASWTLTPDALISQGRNTPLAGWELPGHVTRVWRDGEAIWQDGHEL
ncbi:MAG: dihydroorotase [Gammaproteobacteria bacterium]|nr:MAG: dihydroorotase [Gammaproteobacteria bacterium]